MGIFNNNNHFLHKHLSFLESTGIQGKDGGYINFLANKGVSVNGEYWNTDHSTIDWNKIEAHNQFFYDYEGNEQEIKKWLKQSELKNFEYLFTWLSWDDPIIKIKTMDFIANWQEFNLASGWEGLILITEYGELFFEFTDDWKHHLNSNFEINPNKSATQQCNL